MKQNQNSNNIKNQKLPYYTKFCNKNSKIYDHILDNEHTLKMCVLNVIKSIEILDNKVIKLNFTNKSLLIENTYFHDIGFSEKTGIVTDIFEEKNYMVTDRNFESLIGSVLLSIREINRISFPDEDETHELHLYEIETNNGTFEFEAHNENYVADKIFFTKFKLKEKS